MDTLEIMEIAEPVTPQATRPSAPPRGKLLTVLLTCPRCRIRLPLHGHTTDRVLSGPCPHCRLPVRLALR